tara:strand:+ start:1660 stop:2220 length:561 start_codon:yes stop_codon:yes gene_type:complete
MARLIPQNLKIKIALRMLSFATQSDRLKQGTSLNKAKTVILVYKGETESKYRLVKDIAAYLKKEFGIKRIMRLAYLDVDEKKIPIWHMRKLESDFFCQSDLNWYFRPVKNIDGLIDEPYDILINLDPDASIPLDFFVANSKAQLKVANQSYRRKKDYDILLPPEEGDSWKQRNHRIIKFLSESPLS